MVAAKLGLMACNSLRRGGGVTARAAIQGSDLKAREEWWGILYGVSGGFR